MLYPQREEGQGQASHVEINIPVTQHRRWHSWWSCGFGEPACVPPWAAQPGHNVPICSTMAICSTVPLLPGLWRSPALWVARMKKRSRRWWSHVNSAHDHGNSLAMASPLRDDKETQADVIHLLRKFCHGVGGCSKALLWGVGPVEMFLFFEGIRLFLGCTCSWKAPLCAGSLLLETRPGLNTPKPQIPHHSRRLHG